MFIATDGMMGASTMMSGWGMGLGMLGIVALIFGAGVAVGYVVGTRR